MNVAALRTFLTIIETGSLVQAAAVLNVTQSTVTARLQSLEAELGQTLLNRPKTGVTLTAAGLRLQKYAETITDLWRQAQQEAALPGAFGAVCNIACHPDLWPGLGAMWFNAIRVEQPNVALSVILGGQGELSEWIKSGRADLVIGFGAHAQAGQELFPLITDQIRLYSTNPDSPIKFDPGYVFVDHGPEFSRQHAAAYADAATARLNFGTATLALEHVLRFGGSVYLPERIAADAVTEGNLWALDAPTFRRAAFLVINRTAAGRWDWITEMIRRFQDDKGSVSTDERP